MKKILLITTGGTIACIKTSSGLIPHATPEELLNEVEVVKTFCVPTGLNLMCIDSTDMLPSDWIKIAECIKDNYEDYDGFVICHGTDTLSYTASALSYLIQNSKKPIVLTGAQKPISTDSTDARNNLIDSFRYAVSEKAQGVVVVFDGKVIAGTKAQKIRSKSFNAFNSINLSLLFFSLFVIFGVFGKSKENKYVKVYSALSKERLVRGMLYKKQALYKTATVKKMMSMIDETAINEVVVYDESGEVEVLSQKRIGEIIEKGNIYSQISEYLS